MSTSWIDRIGGWTPEADFAPPATTQDLKACERELRHPLPPDLRQLLLESNGVEGEYGLGLIWSAGRIAADNVMFRRSPQFARLYMPFDPLLFFADAGNGDQFGFVLRDDRRDVFVWNHETDSRTWAAPSLAAYLEWWLDGRLTV
jgi:SMI1-KNR4 cell-wall